MDPETRYEPGYVDPAAVAETRATVVAFSAAARAHVEALEREQPLEGLDRGVTEGTREMDQLIAHFPGLEPALRVVADHIGGSTAPCRGEGSCTLGRDEADQAEE